MLCRMVMPHLRNLHNVASRQQTKFNGLPRKSFPTKGDYFDAVVPLEALAEKEIRETCSIRKAKTTVVEIQRLIDQLNVTGDEINRTKISRSLRDELRKIPNRTHPTVLSYGNIDHPVEIATFGEMCKAMEDQTVSITQQKLRKKTKGQLVDSATILTGLNLMRKEKLGQFCGSRSYYLLNDLAEMEQALIRYTTNYLLNSGFNLVSVPDILPPAVIEGCGMATSSGRSQVYRILPSDHCLSGTSEMALGGFISGRTFRESDLPKRYIAVSRCFRAEAKGSKEERGIYRVHYFTKVEMFSVCMPNQSEEVLEAFNDIQCKLFSSMGLHFKVFDMPVSDLGAPAYRKYDVEAWMPGRNAYGEISSSSNCTDFQSKRLNVYVDSADGSKIHAHTVNGTACAIPRMLISILEQFQQPCGTVEIPTVLQKYMGGKTRIMKKKALPAARFNTHKM